MENKDIRQINKIIREAGRKAKKEVDKSAGLAFTEPVKWPVQCLVGPGLEGAIACESKIGYVNGAKGELSYRGYDIFDLAANSSFEEVSYLLIHGKLPAGKQLKHFKDELADSRRIPKTIKLFMGFPIEEMNAMAALRLGTNMMRQEYTYVDREAYRTDLWTKVSADEDSIPMEQYPRGEARAIYELKRGAGVIRPKTVAANLFALVGYKPCYHLIGGVASIAGAGSRLRGAKLPLDSDPELSHAGNLIYMITGRKPTPVEERIMDVSLILHADHGMNASTFATLVVASTLSDMYFAVGSGIAALNGPLHGGANAQVLDMLHQIGDPKHVKSWFKKASKEKRKIMGFGHRVYKAYDPRARVLGPLAEYLVSCQDNKEAKKLLKTAKKLEEEVVSTLGVKKRIFPNVDFFSGIVYSCLGIPAENFTPIFAVSRVSGWTSRVLEYLEKNRIFRPRAVYVGEFGKKYIPVDKRKGLT